MTTRVAVGSVLTRVYYQVPEWHGFGDVFDRYVDAAAHARLRKDTLWEQGIHNPRVHVDTLWIMRHPDSGVTAEVLVSREEYEPDETRAQWERVQVGDRHVLAVHLNLHDQAAANSWAERMLFGVDGPVITAARVDADGKHYPVDVIHRAMSWRLVTRANPGAFARVCAAIAANPPDLRDGNPRKAASVAVEWIGSDMPPWTWHTGTHDSPTP